MKTLEKVLLVLIIVLLAAGIYVALRNIDFFNVEEIDVSVSGPVTSVSTDMQRIINPLKGRNIFEISLRSLKKTLLAFDGVKEVRIRRYYPGKLIIQIDYNDMSLKAFTLSDQGENPDVVYYFIHDDILEEVKQTTWEAFDRLASVELHPAYAQMIMKWGSDQGFKSMVALAEHLANNNLITSMKYDNNNGNEFGRLVIGISSLNSTLFVRELISVQRLDEALEIISSQFSAGGETVVYDLYANTLVKRT